MLVNYKYIWYKLYSKLQILMYHTSIILIHLSIVIVMSKFAVVIHSLRPELQLDLDSITNGNSLETFTLGSIVSLGEWHHLAINILPCNMQPTYEVC